MSYEDDYWKQRTDDAEKAVAAAFEATDARYHFDTNRMLGEAMRQCKGKNHPTVVHDVVIRQVETKKAELKQLLQQQLQSIITGPMGLRIGSKQDIELLERTLIERVYENSDRNAPYALLQEFAGGVIKACLEANHIPDYRQSQPTRCF